MRPGERFAAGWIALGAVLGGASSFVPLSSDEGAWLAIARRVAAGGVLYRDAIDNKSPFVFALVRMLDALPGPFILVRAMSIGALAALLALGCCSVAVRLGAPVRRARVLGLVVGAAAVLQSVFVLTVELVAIAFVVGALRVVVSDRFLLAGALTATAALFDPRAVVLVPGMIALAIARGGRAGGARTGIVAAGLLAVWAAVVLSLPDVRYALVELNLSSRGSSNPWRPALQVAAAVRALLPVAVGFGFAATVRNAATPADTLPRLGIGSVRTAGWWLLLPATAVAAASVHPYDHYWMLVLPAVPILGTVIRAGNRSRRRLPLPIIAAIALFAVTPALVDAVTVSRAQSRLVERYEQAARLLRAELRPGETFAQFTVQPFLGTFLPEHLGMRSPLLGYVVQPSSRRVEALRDLDRLLGAVVAVVDDGGLSAPEQSVLPPYRPVWRVFHAHLARFPCVRDADGPTVRFLSERCPVR